MIATPIRIFIVLAALVALAPAGAHAKGKPSSVIQGTLVSTTHPLAGQTGNCYCEAQWYTVGLKPGKVTVSIRLVSIGMKFGPSYTLRADLERHNRTILNQGQSACLASAKNCTVTIRFSAKVFRAAPYYIHIIGGGGEAMQYTVQVQGPVYRVK